MTADYDRAMERANEHQVRRQDVISRPTYHLARLNPVTLQLTPVQGLRGNADLDKLLDSVPNMRTHGNANQLVVVQVVSLLDVKTTVVRQDLKPETLVKGKSQEKK